MYRHGTREHIYIWHLWHLRRGYPKADRFWQSDAAAAHVLLQCLLGQGVPIEGWAPSQQVADAIAQLAAAAKRLLPDVALGLWPTACEEAAYDEMRDGSGHVRPAYAGVLAQVEQILWPGSRLMGLRA